MKRQLVLFRQPRTITQRWGAFSVACANRCIENGRAYRRAAAALARARAREAA